MYQENMILHPFLLKREEKEEKRAIRDGFGTALVRLALKDENIIALSADVYESVRLSEFKEKFPERYIECGVSEQNMALIASGLAQMGKIPFMAAYAVFSPGRNWEQIRTTIALSEVPVKIMGMHTGVSVGEDGATHQALEDITLMRVLPHMEVLVPSDAYEAEKAVEYCAYSGKPCYIRFSRHSSSLITTKETPFEIGKAPIYWESQKPEVALYAAGHLLFDALRAAESLEKEGIGVRVRNMCSIKPIDIEAIKEDAKYCGACVSIEEHQILGGLGGTIAEVLTQNTPIPQEMIAMHDSFGQSGKSEDLLSYYGFTEKVIKEKVKRVKERKERGGSEM